MNPEPMTSTSDPAEENTTSEPTPAPAELDDGTVPEKQISRWQGEGGAVHPEDYLY